ncbi:MAG: HlyD family efflux transporter periplasmic adaptor subunit, partial [Pseudomonadota bacterium]
AVLTAPFAGTVVARYLDAGATVRAGEPVVRLNQAGVLEARVGVPVDLARDLEVGQVFDLSLGETSVEATVAGVADDVDAATRSVTVRFSIDESADPAANRALAPGALVRLSLAEERVGRGAWAPLSAIAESYRGLWSVFVVVDEDGVSRIRRKDVTIIAIGDERVYLDGTIDEGDRIVRTAPFRFVPGQEVTVVEDATDGGVDAVDMSALPQ